jgi:hypothetical protein
MFIHVEQAATLVLTRVEEAAMLRSVEEAAQQSLVGVCVVMAMSYTASAPGQQQT